MSIVRIESNGKYWSCAWRDARGTVHRKSLGRKDVMTKQGAREAAMAWALELAKQPAALALPGAEELTLTDWWRRVLAFKGRARESTIRDLEQTLKLVTEFFGEGILLRAIRPHQISEFRAWLENRPITREFKQGIRKFKRLPTTNTIRKHLRNIRNVFSQAVKQQILERNPCMHESCTMIRTERAWFQVGPTETTQLIEACPDTFSRAMVGLARYAGLRQGEVMRLMWADINWDGLTILVRVEANSAGERAETTKHRQRRVPIDPLLLPMLREAYEAARSGDPYVVGGVQEWVDRDKYAQKRMRQVLRLARLDYAKPFHTLRKCRESEWMARYPVPTVAEWMGHDPNVALAHYTRAPEEHFRQAAATSSTDPQEQIRRLEAVIAQLRGSPVTPTETAKNP